MKNWNWNKIIPKVIINLFILYMFFNFYPSVLFNIGDNAPIGHGLTQIARVILVVGTIAVLAFYNKD